MTKSAFSTFLILFAGASVVVACTTSNGNTDNDDDSTGAGGTGTGQTTGGTGGTATGVGGTATGVGGTGTGMGGNDGGMGGNAGGMGGNAGGMGGNAGGMGGMGGNGGAGGSVVNCNTASDCAATEVCDVTTAQCVAFQCNPALAQPAGCVGTDPACIEQLTNSGYGACYEQCDPYDTGCPGNLECRNITWGQWAGLCQNVGVGTKGMACSPPGQDPNGWTINTGCVTGHACLQDANMTLLCYQTCDFFAFGAASCPGTDVCSLGGTCLPPTTDGYENVALEAACVGAQGGENCGLNGDGYTGACNDLSDGLGMVCHAFCSAGDPNACPGTHTVCYDVFNAPLLNDVGACSIP